MPEAYDLTLLDPDNKLGRDIAIMRADMEELHAKARAHACRDRTRTAQSRKGATLRPPPLSETPSPSPLFRGQRVPCPHGYPLSSRTPAGPVLD
jgi:hypothetical protein